MCKICCLSKSIRTPYYFLVLVLVISPIISCDNETEVTGTEEEEEIIVSFNDAIVSIDSPNNKDIITPGTMISFTGSVSGIDSMNEDSFTAIWSSNIDGVLHEESIDNSKIPPFSTSELSHTTHQIRLTVSNGVGEEKFDEITIYNSIRMYEIVNESNRATISWSKANAEDFLSYQVFRSRYENVSTSGNAELIYTTQNLQDTVFVDITATLGERHYYKVLFESKKLAPDMIASNVKSVVNGVSVQTDLPIYKMVSDPNRDYVYALVNTNSIYESNASGYGLLFINTATREVEGRILPSTRFTDLSIDPTGNSLYLCSRSNQIHQINLDTQEPERIFNMAFPAHKIEVGNNQRLYYHITPPTSGATQFRIYDLENGTDIPYQSTMAAAYSSFRHGDFELGENNTIYHGESNSSNSNLSEINTTNDVFSLEKQWGSNDYMLPNIILRDGTLFWNHLILDTNFNQIGSFTLNNQERNIQAVSPNGKKALTSGTLFNTSDQSSIKSIPAYFETSTFINDDEIIFAKSVNVIGNIFESTIFFYDL